MTTTRRGFMQGAAALGTASLTLPFGEWTRRLGARELSPSSGFGPLRPTRDEATGRVESLLGGWRRRTGRAVAGLLTPAPTRGEEVAWTPTRGPGPAHTSMPQPPSPFPVVGHETAAAVNLLSMSIHGHEHDLGGNRGAGAAFAGRDGSLSYDNQQVGIMSEHKYLELCKTRSSH